MAAQRKNPGRNYEEHQRNLRIEYHPVVTRYSARAGGLGFSLAMLKNLFPGIYEQE